jgi:hypothetical protein
MEREKCGEVVLAALGIQLDTPFEKVEWVER